MDVSGKVVVVTGGGSGIGAAMARRFADAGAAGIAVADVNAAAAADVAAEVVAKGGRAFAYGTDVADEEQVRALVAATVSEYGPIDLMCSNAGVASGTGLDSPADQWATSWAVNVQAHVYAARAVIPDMVERGEGYLLNTCSAAGLLTQPGDAPYAVTKHAAVAFAEWLLVTYGDAGIKVSALCPQGVRTPLLMHGLGASSEGARVVAAAGTILEPSEVADVVIAGLAAEKFLILPHPEVAEYVRRKGDDRDRWIAGIRRLVASLDS